MSSTEWFSKARFGMMLHWGLYSLLAGEYRGEQMGGADNGSGELGEWAQTYFRIPCREYEKLAEAFNPVGFDAEEYARLAKEAGMNYIVLTSKHHEGFAMFKSAADRYNVVDATPYGRDIVGQFAAACKKYGLKFGLYYSQEVDWHDPDGGAYDCGYKNVRSSWTNNWDFPDNANKDYSRCLERKIKPQVKEILTQYGEIALIWFDTPHVISKAQSDELYALVKHYQPNCLVNSRIGNGVGDYTSLGDNQVPGDKKEKSMLYETAATLNDTWGYKSYDQHWKSAEEVISLLTRLASRNVNYLLNIGPDHIGRIPAAAQNVLKEGGARIKINGEAVYGTSPSPYNVELSSGPVTEKDGSLYFVLNKPGNEIKIPGVLTRIAKVELLGTGELKFIQNEDVVSIPLPNLTGKICPVLKLSADTPIEVDEGIIEMPERSFKLQPATAQIEGNIKIGRACDIENWRDQGSLTWTFIVKERGNYVCELAVNGLHGVEPLETEIVLTVNGYTRSLCTKHDKDIDSLISRHHKGLISEAGVIELVEGVNTVSIRLAAPVDRDMFRFAYLTLRRKQA